jgi:hypothetical protein
LVAVTVMAVTSLVACGRDAPIPDTALPAEIASFTPAPPRQLDAVELAAQAVDVDALATLLDTEGFRAAVTRMYRGSDPRLRRVDVLLVRFATDEGAARLLAWQRDHVADVIGQAEPTIGLGPSGTMTFVHQPEGCCAKEQVTSLAVWRRGTDVIRVVLSGADADGPVATEVLSWLYERLPLA